jgi:hypothetical protein
MSVHQFEEHTDVLFPEHRSPLASERLKYLPGSVFSIKPKLEELGVDLGKTFVVGISQSGEDRQEQGVQLEPINVVSFGLQASSSATGGTPKDTASSKSRSSQSSGVPSSDGSSKDKEGVSGSDRSSSNNNTEGERTSSHRTLRAIEGPTESREHERHQRRHSSNRKGTPAILSQSSSTPQGSSNGPRPGGSDNDEEDATSVNPEGDQKKGRRSAVEQAKPTGAPTESAPSTSRSVPESLSERTPEREETQRLADSDDDESSTGNFGNTQFRRNVYMEIPGKQIDEDEDIQSYDRKESKLDEESDVIGSEHTQAEAEGLHESPRARGALLTEEMKEINKFKSKTDSKGSGKAYAPKWNLLQSPTQRFEVSGKDRKIEWNLLKMDDTTRDVDSFVTNMPSGPVAKEDVGRVKLELSILKDRVERLEESTHAPEPDLIKSFHEAQSTIRRLNEALDQEEMSAHLMREEIQRLHRIIEDMRRVREKEASISTVKAKLDESERLLDYAQNFRKRQYVMNNRQQADPGEPLRQLIAELQAHAHDVSTSGRKAVFQPHIPKVVSYCVAEIVGESSKATQAGVDPSLRAKAKLPPPTEDDLRLRLRRVQDEQWRKMMLARRSPHKSPSPPPPN